MTNDQKIEYIKILLERKRVQSQIDENLYPKLSEIEKKSQDIIKVLESQGTSISKLNKDALEGRLEARTDVLNAEKNLKETLDKQIARLEKEIKQIELLKPINGKDGIDGQDGKSIKGDKGDKGEDGKSIKGDKGDDGKTIEGKDGVSISSTELKDGDLILTFSNGEKKNVGRVKGASGTGHNGKSVNITYSHDAPLITDGIDGDLWVVY
ncbi:MAG: hypothetical protein WCL51_03660 [Bacteroidota bacterium]